MIKKLIFFALALLIIGCSAKKPVVRTTKKAPYKKSVAVKKPVNAVKPEKKGEVIEVIVTEEPGGTEILEAVTPVKVTTAIVLEYIDTYKATAKNNMKDYNIPASIILAQGILESGAGTGPLSRIANNHFGIKCHAEWDGPSVKYDDDAKDECFRKYSKSSESYKDHSLFLTTRAWYLPLFDLDKDDYKGWAKGLKKAGYATDPKYPEKLISIIERYQLNQYDAEVLGKNYTPTKPAQAQISSNSADLYEVTKGDTLYSISRKFNISIDDLKRKNNLSSNDLSIGQNLKI